MNRSSFILLLVLGALWGASFLFLRIAAPVLGAVWLIEIRVLIAGLVLLPLVVFNRQWISMLNSYRHLLIVGALNSALPFVLIAHITIELSAGATSILNAIVPIAGVVFSYLVMKEQLGLAQLCGIALGFVGVLVLMLWQQQGVSSPPLLVVVLAIIAAFSYVAGAHYTKQRLVEMPVMVYVAGTQLAAAILLLPLLPFFVPQQFPDVVVIGSVIGLAVLSTSLALVLYFKLIHQIGPTKTLTVTYLIPFFGLLWGSVFLDEAIAMNQIAGCALILSGVALSVGSKRFKKLV
ncbi:MAG: EamA family transporter [Gammaproteobacteria bacterium]|nr:MAG: EamA family transporter [Gammaproteobacteria bacterium]